MLINFHQPPDEEKGPWLFSVGDENLLTQLRGGYFSPIIRIHTKTKAAAGHDDS